MSEAILPPTTERPRHWQAVAVLAAASGAIAGALLAAGGSGWQWLHWICKPMATALILWLAWWTVPTVSARYQRWIVAGIACSLLGDVLLMLPRDLFVPGLLAFLLGHLCFLGGFLGDSRFATRPWLLLACLVYAAINLWLLWGSIGPALRVPVVVYVLVLSCMGGQALGRARSLASQRAPGRSGARHAAIGALWFMLSDSLLAWNRFHAPIAGSAVWVLTTYYLALWWIARSVQRDHATTEAATT